MSAEQSSLPVQRTDRRMFAWSVAVIVLIAFVGFARTYYLKGVFATPPLTRIVHVHAVLMTLWVAFFALQAWLVAVRRTDLHRRLGVAGAVLAAAIVGVGIAASIDAARRGVGPGFPPLVFLVIPLGAVVVFAVLVAAAIRYRRRSDVHKRLMLVATLSILTPAIARIQIDALQAGGALLFLGLTDLLVLACVGYDTLRNRRLHPAFAWATLFFFVSQPLRIVLGKSAVWMTFATWLTA